MAHDEERARRAFERLGKRAKGCLWSKYGHLLGTLSEFVVFR